MSQELDTRRTVGGTINEAFRKFSINPITTFGSKVSLAALDYLNDVVYDLSSRGRWPQLRATIQVTAQSSVASYTMPTNTPIKRIEEIVFDDEIAEMLPDKPLFVEERIRSTGFGLPRYYAITGVNASAKPVFSVSPVPGQSQDNKLFTVKYYQKPSLYTTNDFNTVIPLPSRPIVQGLMAYLTLDESLGAPNSQYQSYYALYERYAQEALNEYTADTGDNIQFVPGYRGGN